MKKIRLCCGMLALVSLLNSTMAIAAENDKQENVVIVSNCALSDVNEQKLKEMASASFTTKEGVQIPVDTIIEVKEIQSEKAVRSLGGKTYEVSVTATIDTSNGAPQSRKIDSDTGDTNTSAVIATCEIKMEWTDVPGTKNTMDRIYGDYTIIKGTRSSSKYFWGYKRTQYGLNNKSYVGSFDYSPDYTSPSITGSLFAQNKITFSTGEVLEASVTPTIFD